MTLDGLGIVLCYNGVNDDVLFRGHWPRILAAIEGVAWPGNVDFFPEFGMSSVL